MDILGFAGSLRKDSYNLMLLKASKHLLPEGVNLKVFDLNSLPLYNDDIARQSIPNSVNEFRGHVQNSCALLLASPEYNYSFSGVLKNALDWASTLTLGNLIYQKPVAIMGTTTGLWGTTRSQLHLRQVLHAINARVIARPEVYISNAKTAFDENGALIDNKSNQLLKSLIQALIDEIGRSGC